MDRDERNTTDPPKANEIEGQKATKLNRVVVVVFQRKETLIGICLLFSAPFSFIHFFQFFLVFFSLVRSRNLVQMNSSC